MFKKAFKYYKAKEPEPILDDVIDFEQPDKHKTLLRAYNLTDNLINIELEVPPGLQAVYKWQCFELLQHPGLIVIRNPFKTLGQRYWIARCLRDFPKQPNMVNLSSELFSNEAISNWWHTLQTCKDKNEKKRLKTAMRWATLGYHHNWNTKVYSETMHTLFPHDLGKLCQYFANIFHYTNFKAEAAIVNYYPIGTTLAGHTDHSEMYLQAPLFSISFGQTAIFLIGGKTKEIKPTAMYLRSGDVLIMSEESRLCYHAVPRIMKSNREPWNLILTNQNESKKLLNNNMEERFEDDFQVELYNQLVTKQNWQPYNIYLNDSRINVNVRQVLTPGETKLHK